MSLLTKETLHYNTLHSKKPNTISEFKTLQKTVYKRSTDLTKSEPVFFEKRYFLHKIAYTVLPKKWKKKAKKKKKRIKYIVNKLKVFRKKYKKFIFFKKIYNTLI